MDTLTHALSGALLARATEPKKPRPDQLPRRTRMWVGFIAAAFPDSDFITHFIDPLTYLTVHRGITHSVILLPLWAMALAVLFMLLVRGKHSWRAFVGVCAVGIGVHIAGDVITAFGTMIFAPFSDWRAQIPTTFIIDPYFTAIILGGLIASAVWKHTRKAAVMGLAVLAAYVGFQGLLHHRAVTLGEAYAAEHRLDTTQVKAIPQPFSPFNWMVVIPQQDAYVIAYVSLWRDTVPETPPAGANWLQQVNASYYPHNAAIWKRVPRFGAAYEAVLAEQVWFSEALAPYRRFALFPAVYRVDQKKDAQCVWYNDLRFALMGRDMPFRYGACRNTPGSTRVTGGGTPGAAIDSDAIWRVYRLFNDEDGREIVDAIHH